MVSTFKKSVIQEKTGSGLKEGEGGKNMDLFSARSFSVPLDEFNLHSGLLLFFFPFFFFFLPDDETEA